MDVARTAEVVWYVTGRFYAGETDGSLLTIEGVQYDFRDLTGFGVTQWGVAATEPVLAPLGYASVVPFLGSAIRVG